MSSRLLNELRACGRSRDLEKAKALHAECVATGTFCDVYVATSVITMYAKCGSLVHARSVFEGICNAGNIASWNALMFGYIENGDCDAALLIFARMQAQNLSRNALSYVAALKACSTLETGMTIHSLALKSIPNIRVENAVIDMYGRCGSMVDAVVTFGRIQFHDAISWNSLISRFAENGMELEALELFSKMACEPTSRTILACLKACISLAEKQEGPQDQKITPREKGIIVHIEAAQLGYDEELYVASSLVDLYAKCGSMIDAWHAFERAAKHDLVSWNALVFGYAENGEEELALELYERLQVEGFTPDARTYSAALKACTGLALKEKPQNVDGILVKVESRTKGLEIHQQAARGKCCFDLRVATTLVDLYSKCGTMIDAQRVFELATDRDVLLWNALMAGYVDNGKADMALRLFSRMGDGNPTPDAVSFLVSLKACGSLGALDLGRSLHSSVLPSWLDGNGTLVATLVDFYGKCGAMVEAQGVFDSYTRKKYLVVWNALMTGYSRQGNTSRVLELFEEMQDERIQPDDVTFLCVLTACSHAGLVGKGKEYFESMSRKFGVEPNLKHYTCIVDMLGRANRPQEVADVLKAMPFEADDVAWTSVLASCRNLRHPELRKAAFEGLLGLGVPNLGGALLAGA